VDVREVFPVANSQPQSHLHNPGVGVGGHCIPVYPYLLIDRTEHSRLAALARTVNDAMPAHAVEMLSCRLGGLTGRRVLVLGIAFRAGVKEAANSPAFDLVRELHARGAVALVHDPLYAAEELCALGVEPVMLEPPPPADAAIIQTAHPQYRTLDWGSFPGLRLILDGRAALDPAAVRSAGVEYAAIGRGELSHSGMVPPPK
jgi:nucleotide sugar dehydrogenase